MKYCSKCQVKVSTDLKKCPLCSIVLLDLKTQIFDEHNPECGLSDTYEESSNYPKSEIDVRDRYNLVFRLYLFISIVISSTSLLVNLLTYKGVLWSLYIIGTILYLWITVAYPVFVKRKIGQIIVINAISTSIYLYLLELGTISKGWGLSYAIPFLFIAATLMITFIILLRRLKWKEYSTYQTIMVILGFLPVFFCITGLVTPIWPSVLSAFYSLLTLTGMFIFADKKYKDELIKRFHL